ncbi:hypothetical protein C815_01956 [Firmicutes bacterium M10-2]|nr:hypothetical protein C815_01956 [Firmicutes bacterium M10-2]
MAESKRYRNEARDEREIKMLKNRLHRMIGQMQGIEKMIDEGRYCGDIILQIGALESALQSFGYMLLNEHLHCCVVNDIHTGKTETMDEVMELIKKLK